VVRRGKMKRLACRRYTAGWWARTTCSAWPECREVYTTAAWLKIGKG
jgi:hypothetical protein